MVKEFDKLRKNIFASANDVFWKSLNTNSVPSNEALRQATSNTEEYLEHSILSDECLHSIFQNCSEENIQSCKENLRLLFIEEKIKLTVADIITNSQTSILRLSIGTSIGCIVGGLFANFVEKLLRFSSIYAGFIGCILGSFVFTYILGKIATNERLKQRILAFLGISALTEIGTRRFFRIKQSGKKFFKKVAMFFVVIFAVLFMKSETTFNKTKYSEVLSANINEWLNYVFLISQILMKLSNNRIFSSEDKIVSFVVSELSKLSGGTTKENYEREISYILTYLKSIGIGIINENEKTWNSNLEEFYNKYGIIEVGDEIIIEKDAIVKDGIVIKKGLVRKNRKND